MFPARHREPRHGVNRHVAAQRTPRERLEIETDDISSDHLTPHGGAIPFRQILGREPERRDGFLRRLAGILGLHAGSHR
jgi:hypothetical protein